MRGSEPSGFFRPLADVGPVPSGSSADGPTRVGEELAERGYSIGPTPCRHSIYHHGCPSCDRQDPEDRDD